MEHGWIGFPCRALSPAKPASPLRRWAPSLDSLSSLLSPLDLGGSWCPNADLRPCSQLSVPLQEFCQAPQAAVSHPLPKLLADAWRSLRVLLQQLHGPGDDRR